MAGDTRLKGMLTEGREAVTILLGFGVFFGGILASPVPNAAKLPATAACAVFFLMFAVYLYKLRGADEPPGSPARREFDLFHENLELGFGFNDWYARSLTRVLDSLDRFFRDADKEEVAKLARFAAAPPKVAQCWSAPAYDKCLALALLYPLATMFLVWVATGHAGDAERAVGLDGSPAGAFAWRLGVPASVAILVFAWFKFQRKPDWKKALVLFTGGVGSGFSMMFFAGFGLGAVAGSFICVVISTVFFFDLLAVAGAVALIFGFGVSAVVAVAREFSFARAISDDFTVICAQVAVLVGTGVVAYAFDLLKDKGRLGIGLLILTFVAFSACLISARYESHLQTWPRAGALIVFFVVLTLFNAPFDWLAIGLTRYLLRWGLARGGPWPVVLALVDAVSAAFSVALLAFACVEAVQLFGDIAAHFGGGEKARIIHLGDVFASLKQAPTAPENLWIWFMLFSTAIPSAINLLIACAAGLRSWPFVNRWVVIRINDAEAMSEFDKLAVAGALAAQWAVGAIIAYGLIYALFVGVGPYVAPAYAEALRDHSEALARCNVPARVMIWLFGGGWTGCD